MKVFHTEKGNEVVYVQMQDIIYISNEINIPIPASIFTKVFTGITIVNDSNRFKFVRFAEKHEVEFFKDLDFILDYDKYKDLNNENFEKEVQKLVNQANEIAKKWNSMNEKEREKNYSILEEHKKISYMLRFMVEIDAVRHGRRLMPFPEFVKTTQKE